MRKLEDKLKSNSKSLLFALGFATLLPMNNIYGENVEDKNSSSTQSFGRPGILFMDDLNNQVGFLESFSYDVSSKTYTVKLDTGLEYTSKLRTKIEYDLEDKVIHVMPDPDIIFKSNFDTNF